MSNTVIRVIDTVTTEKPRLVYVSFDKIPKRYLPNIEDKWDLWEYLQDQIEFVHNSNIVESSFEIESMQTLNSLWDNWLKYLENEQD